MEFREVWMKGSKEISSGIKNDMKECKRSESEGFDWD